MSGAPETLDGIQGRAVPDHGDDGPLGERHAKSGCRGHAESEPAHGGADEAERLAGEQPVVDLRPVDGSLLEDDRVRRQALCERGEYVARRQRVTGRGRIGRWRRPERLWRLGVAGLDALGERACHLPRRREHGELDGAPVHFRRVVAHQRELRSGLGEPARRPGRLPEGAGSEEENGVVRGEPLAQARPVGGEEAGEEWVILRKARAGAEGLLEDRCDQPLGEGDERPPRFGVVRARTDDERGRLCAGEE